VHPDLPAPRVGSSLIPGPCPHRPGSRGTWPTSVPVAMPRTPRPPSQRWSCHQGSRERTTPPAHAEGVVQASPPREGDPEASVGRLPRCRVGIQPRLQLDASRPPLVGGMVRRVRPASPPLSFDQRRGLVRWPVRNHAEGFRRHMRHLAERLSRSVPNCGRAQGSDVLPERGPRHLTTIPYFLTTPRLCSATHRLDPHATTGSWRRPGARHEPSATRSVVTSLRGRPPGRRVGATPIAPPMLDTLPRLRQANCPDAKAVEQQRSGGASFATTVLELWVDGRWPKPGTRLPAP